MSEITRHQCLALFAAGGASFLGLSERAFGEPNRGPISPWARLKYPGRNGDDDEKEELPNGGKNAAGLRESGGVRGLHRLIAIHSLAPPSGRGSRINRARSPGKARAGLRP